MKNEFDIFTFICFFAGLTLFVIGFALGGGGDHSAGGSLPWFCAGLAVMAFSTLLINNQTLQIIVGSTMFLYGVWWVLLQWIETTINLITYTLLVVGMFVLVLSLLRPPKDRKHRAKPKTLIIYYAILIAIALTTFFMCLNGHWM